MKYVYILESLDGEHFYVGVTDDVPARLVNHNAGEVPHTSKYRRWRLKTYIAFSDEKQAFAFERYLKSASGRACHDVAERAWLKHFLDGWLSRTPDVMMQAAE